MTNGSIPYTGAVEGSVDEAVLRKVAASAGCEIATVYVADGKNNLIRRLPGFNAAAAHAPWIALLDLDSDAACAPERVDALLPVRAEQMRFRVVVREIEAWLLGDRERFAQFFAVAKSRIPLYAEGVEDPKQALVNLARRSRRRAIRDDLVPAEGSGRTVGRAYEARLIEYVLESEGWRVDVAASQCDSLRRCIEALTPDEA